jgi:hypothetical protein
MYTAEDLEYKSINGIKGVGFLPNTVYYFIPENTPLYKNIKNSKMGMIWHTNYTGNTIESLSASFNVNDSMIKSTKDVYVKTPMVKLDQIGFDSQGEKRIEKNIDDIKSMSKDINWKKIDEIINSEYSKEITMYINQKVRDNRKLSKNDIDLFKEFVKTRYEKAIEKLKSDKGKAKKIDQMHSVLDSIDSHSDSLFNLFNLSGTIEALKDIFVSKMNSIKFGPITYYQTDKGYVPADYEGWVISDSGSNVKFVNRPAFSRMNMLHGKYS